MPQIVKARRKPLEDRTINIEQVGDVCYLFTKLIIIPQWMADPSWTVASKLHMQLVQKPDITQLRHLVRGAPFNDDELLNQAALAYHEFYRRVVANYEDMKARQNTDVFAGVQFGKTKLLQGE